MNNFTDDDYLNIAIEEAKKAERLGEVPVGAVLVADDGQIIAKAHNCPITTDNPTAHAEIEVLRQAGRELGNYRLPYTTLYVTLEPCPMCAGAILQARIPHVVIGCMNPKAGCAGSVLNLFNTEGFNHKVECTLIGGHLGTECSMLMKNFFKELRIEKTT